MENMFEKIAKATKPEYQFSKDTLDHETLDYCCELYRITGQIEAYTKAKELIWECGIRNNDLMSYIEFQVDLAIKKSSNLIKMKNENKNGKI